MKKKIIFGLIILTIFLGIGTYHILSEVNPISKNMPLEHLKCIEYNKNPFIKDFDEYFKYNNKKAKLNNLKLDLDDISVEYINKYIENSKYWHKCINFCIGYSEENLWTKYDRKLFKNFEKMEIPPLYSRMKFEDKNFNPYIYKSLYGMSDLPKSILEKINGKDILDIGAGPGDTVYTFHKFFPKSNIYAYEPENLPMDTLMLTLKEMRKEEKNTYLIHPIKKWVSYDNYVNEIQDGDIKRKIKYVSLDKEYSKMKRKNLGLIKMDVEGFESSVISGAEKIIKKYKPVLVIAIYHNPYDFFEMKDKVKELNSDYKFMIRRSEDIFPDADLVLIAY